MFCFRQSIETGLLNLLTEELTQAFPEDVGLRVEWAFVATWDRVTYVGVYECYSDSNDARIKRNTFQLVLASAKNSTKSYALFK